MFEYHVFILVGTGVGDADWLVTRIRVAAAARKWRNSAILITFDCHTNDYPLVLLLVGRGAKIDLDWAIFLLRVFAYVLKVVEKHGFLHDNSWANDRYPRYVVAHEGMRYFGAGWVRAGGNYVLGLMVFIENEQFLLLTGVILFHYYDAMALFVITCWASLDTRAAAWHGRETWLVDFYLMVSKALISLCIYRWCVAAKILTYDIILFLEFSYLPG